ncbi:MAG: hypothetical protein HZB59_05735 [Ignavibacteriales bacterium]|nr:hypothetical protein [Ignavibacteriales bacterium]
MKNSPFMIKNIVRLPSSNSVFPYGIVTIGDVSNGIGFIIYDDNGNIVNENYISLPDYKIWTNSVGVLNSTNDSVKFAGCGKIQATGNNNWYAFLINFTLLKDGGIKIDTSKIFVNIRFDLKGMVINKDSLGLKYYFSGELRNWDSSMYSPFVCRVNDSLEFDWHKYISSGSLKNPRLENDQLLEYDNSLIIVGNYEVEKNKNSKSTGYWSSGFLASYGKDGTMKWIKSQPITDYDDVFLSAKINQNYLFVTGFCAAGLNTLTGNYAGLGLLMKYNLSNGEQIWAMKIGQDYYQSGINAVSIQSAHAYVAGWANLYTLIMGCKSWYADIDISKPPLGKVDDHFNKEFILTPSNSYNKMNKMLLLR